MKRIIYRYQNRKLYDSYVGKYTNLKKLVRIMKKGDDIHVVNRENGEDITNKTLVDAMNASGMFKSMTYEDIKTIVMRENYEPNK